MNNALNIIKEIHKPNHIAEWPNDAYRKFMKLIVESNISNKIKDKIIKFLIKIVI